MAGPFKEIVQGGAGTSIFAPAVTGKIVRLLSLAGGLGGAGSVAIQDTDGTVRSGAVPVGANGAVDLDYNPEGWTESASGKGMQLVSVGGAFNGMAQFKYVPG